MRSIALANQKGGVGKTTTAVHLAHGLAMTGQRVVMLDLDPQGNATLAVQSMGSDEPGGDGPLEPMRPLADNLWLLPSPGAERNLSREVHLDRGRLAGLVKSLGTDANIDWLVVDCPPRMDEWGWAGLSLCNEAVVPVQAEFFSMHGLSQMMQTLAAARREFPGRAALRGVLPTMVDVREPIASEVLTDLRANLQDALLDAVIYRDSQVVEAASHGTTLFEYNVLSKGARCYGELVREVLHGRT